MFELHPTLKNDTYIVGQLSLSTVLLMNNSLLPWVILVPRRSGIRELYELNLADQKLSLQESSMVGKALMLEFGGDKLNVASIGNMVPQLHVHHIVRFHHDPVWPRPVWGNLAHKPYTQTTSKQMLKRLRSILGNASPEFQHHR